MTDAITIPDRYWRLANNLMRQLETQGVALFTDQIGAQQDLAMCFWYFDTKPRSEDYE